MSPGTNLLLAGTGLVAFLILVILALNLLVFHGPPPGKLILRTVPSGVSVAVDDAFRGVTPDTGLVVTFAESGHHHLALTLAGYQADTSTVFLGLDEVLELEVVMGLPGMGFIRGGAFEMGSESGEYNEKPVHRVVLAPFYIDRTEVTVAAFRTFLPRYVSPFPSDEMPAVGVSWEEATDYCASLGKRLPSEAEWERACRGARGIRYSTGDMHDSERARTGLEMGDGPARVKAFSPGNGGLYGMTGNVWEWCADWYGRDYYRKSPEHDPRGPVAGTQRVLRGGAWYSNARYSRCTHRPGNIKKTRNPSFGFRCVKDME